MLRALYLVCMYLRHGGNMCDFLGQSQPATHGRGEPVQPGNPDNQDYLKRRVIRRKLGIWAVVSSFIADSDVVADWLFYTTDVSSAKGALPKFGLAFAVLGTMLWFVHVTEGHVVDKALRSVTFRCCKLRGISRAVLVSNTPLGYLTYLPLRLQMTLNIVLEDLPQLIITFLVEDSITSTAGVINVTTAAMAVLAKVVDVIQKSKAEVPLAMQLRMIDIEHVVMGELLDAQDEAEEKANASAELVLALAEVSEGSLADRSRRAFALLHKSPQNVEAVQRRFEHTELEINGFLAAESVLSCCCRRPKTSQLEGGIPSQLGGLTRLTRLSLLHCSVSGEIPRELGGLVSLQALHLPGNLLTGQIPREIGRCSSLKALILSRNKLTGPIPAELGDLVSLEWLSLSTNRLTGGIPPELGRLVALKRLNLSRNQLTGKVPPELENLVNIVDLELSHNQLNVEVPENIWALIRSKEATFTCEPQQTEPTDASGVGESRSSPGIQPHTNGTISGFHGIVETNFQGHEKSVSINELEEKVNDDSLFSSVDSTPEESSDGNV